MTFSIRSFFQGNERTVKAKKNILFSMGIKGLSILTTFVLVPLTLGYLNETQYGIWLTMSSFLIWINFFDVGLGNGLRNRLTEALAKKDYELGRIYVSTTVFLLTVVVCAFYLILLAASPWINWYSILNATHAQVEGLGALILIVFSLFGANFVFKFINMVFVAQQMPVFNNLFLLASDLLSLCVIYGLTIYTKGDLTKVALVYSAAPIVVYLLAYPYAFCYKYKELAPRLSAIQLSYTKDLMGLGLQFFVIQIACMITFSTTNILITQLLGPEQVTPYNIAYKLFNGVAMIFFIILTPMWSAVTDAYTKGDLGWIKNAIRHMIKLWGVTSMLMGIVLMASPFIYSFWIQDKTHITFSVSLMTGIYMCMLNWNNLFSYVINGVGKIRLQLYLSVITSLLFIPIALYLGKHYGIEGILGAMCLSLAPMCVLLPVQYHKIINKKNKGVWNQ
ncbi:MAG: oligosaccharide flippase family protein [Bacteroidaceae bacterium]|nr:oligosaccharide flippase family protein [Bacteroidaceae bacterium]